MLDVEPVHGGLVGEVDFFELLDELLGGGNEVRVEVQNFLQLQSNPCADAGKFWRGGTVNIPVRDFTLGFVRFGFYRKSADDRFAFVCRFL